MYGADIDCFGGTSCGVVGEFGSDVLVFFGEVTRRALYDFSTTILASRVNPSGALNVTGLLTGARMSKSNVG